MNPGQLSQRINSLLQERADQSTLNAALKEIIAEFGCAVGTIHRLNPTSGLLELVTHHGMPDVVVERVRNVPVGKGMAGLAAERRECVSICNLQTDTSGDVRPGAKMTGMEGSIAVPMIFDGEVRGVLGVAKPTAYEFSDEEKKRLLQLAATLGSRIAL